jgi:uncharacterized LabA/DUF88 family protein
VLFKKPRAKHEEKGVDISLTKEMLVNAFNKNYDRCLLVAGDEDYVELVKEVKRYGQVIYGCFLKDGLSPKLKLSFDYFTYLEDTKLEGSFKQYQVRKSKHKS